MIIGNVKKNGLNHFIIIGKFNNTEIKNYTTMCNTFVAGWYRGEKEPLNLREWRGQKICSSCALQAYNKELVDLIPNILNKNG